jgi:hypothetical protein
MGGVARIARAGLTIALAFGAACSDGQNAHDGGAGSAPIATGGSGGQAAGASGAGGAAAVTNGNGGAMHTPIGNGGSGGAMADPGPKMPLRDAAIGASGDSGCVDDRCEPDTRMKPFKGVANSPCEVRKKLGVSWYYNWEQSESERCPDGDDVGGAFVPMIWGHGGGEQNANSIADTITRFVDVSYPYVLGFNEPDNSSQSNISVDKAIELWPAFDNPMIKIVSPGTAANANPGQAWFSDFMQQVNADADLRVDVIALHWYGWNVG